jgi:hypothetical protein
MSPPFTLRNFPPQIWQTHINTSRSISFLFAILPRTSTFRAGQANNLTGIFAKPQRTSHRGALCYLHHGL